MMASLTMAGLAVRNAGASKNILAGVMNASAVAIFALSSDVSGCRRPSPPSAPVRRVGRGVMLRTVNEKLLKLGVIVIGVLLTIGLFWKAA